MALNWLTTNLANARAKLSDEIGKFRNREMMEAVVAGCAIVAAADGAVSAAEKQKMIGFLQNSAELKVFKMEDVIASFNAYVAKFDFDPEIGRGEALRAIAKLKGKAGADRLLVRVCIAIANSDGSFDASERTAISTICRDLGLAPADFDL